MDADSKIIIDYAITNAAVHDSNEFVDFIDETDKVVYADSAYAGREIAEKLPENVENSIHEKGYRNRPLTDEQKLSNRKKSKIRVRIEHVYGFMTGSMRGLRPQHRSAKSSFQHRVDKSCLQSLQVFRFATAKGYSGITAPKIGNCPIKSRRYALKQMIFARYQRFSPRFFKKDA